MRILSEVKKCKVELHYRHLFRVDDVIRRHVGWSSFADYQSYSDFNIRTPINTLVGIQLLQFVSDFNTQ